MFQLAAPVFMLVSAAAANAAESPATAIQRPVRIIFDTDMGNDVDDALALGVIHALQNRGECELLAVTVTKDEETCAPYIDAVNTFYGRGGIPIGVTRSGVTPHVSKFTPLANKMDDGKPRYPHDLKSGKDAPEATEVLRKVLAAQPDHSVVIAQVGFSTNLANLLDTPADKFSDLNGRDLVAKKVSVLSLMAGSFQLINGSIHPEYNVIKDIPAAQKIVNEWPTPLVFSGYEIGLSIPYPAASILEDFNYVEHHPLPEAYQLYFPTPHERPTWDLTSVLWGIRPNRGYFDLSPAGKVTICKKGVTSYKADPKGNHYYLIADETQRAVVRETLAALSSEPPKK